MKWTTAASAVLLIVSYPTPVVASFKTGNDLLPDCAADRSETTYYQRQGYCMGYVIGVVDDEIMYSDALGKRLYCMPDQVTAGQIKDIFVAYVQRHPEMRHLGAQSLIASAMIEAFPCPPK